MKQLLAIVLLVSALLTTARAQQDADSRYITIYGVIQQADTYTANGQPAEALAAYQDAQSQLQKFQQIYPDWETDIVNYRLSDLAGKITALQAQLPAPTNSVAASQPAPSAAAAAATNVPVNNLQLNVLQSQLQSLKDQNSQLQAKLQEALSTQPQMVDVSQLTKANDQIRALMKENDLLKASLSAAAKPTPAGTGTTGSDTEVSQLRSQLADTTQKLADAQARAQKLADENTTLQLALANSTNQTASSASALRDENDRLKSQLDSMKAESLQSAANNSAAVSESTSQLNATKAQVAALESAVMLANLEKTALEDRLKRVNSQLELVKANQQVSQPPATNAAPTVGSELVTTIPASTPQPAPEAVVSAAPAAEPSPAAQPAPVQQPAAIAATPTPVTPAPVTQPGPAAQSATEAQTAAAAQPTLAPETTPAPQPAAETQPAAVQQSVPVATAAEPQPSPAPQAAPAPAATQTAPAAETPANAPPQMSASTAELVASAQRHFSNHEYDQAEEDYRKILEHDQNNGLVLANLAAIELQENKVADAERDVKAALALSPDDAYNLGMLGKIKFAEGDYDEALNDLSQSAKLDPNNPETQNYLGVTYSHKGLRTQAEVALRRAIQLDPNYAPAHNNIAVIYLTQNPPLPQLARWHYQKALDAGQPRNPDLEKLLAAKGAPLNGTPQ